MLAYFRVKQTGEPQVNAVCGECRADLTAGKGWRPGPVVYCTEGKQHWIVRVSNGNLNVRAGQGGFICVIENRMHRQR